MTAPADPEPYRAPTDPELRRVPAGGGWRIALWRYRSAGDRCHHPVVLCHGLAANRLPFDLTPERSLARHLARRGYEVFALELRGHGAADRLPGTPRFGWDFDTYLDHDLPAALGAVRWVTGADRVHFVGHSMGGILLYAWLALTGGRGLASGVAVGSALDYTPGPSDFAPAARLSPLARVLPAVPLGPLARLQAPLAGLRPLRRLDAFNLWPPNLERPLHRRVMAEGFHTVSAPVLAQLATLFEPGGLRDAAGEAYLPRLPRGALPLLAVAGTRDHQCHPDAASDTARRAGAAVRIFDAGHIDLLVGKRAPVTVFPELDAFLDHADGRGRRAAGT